MKTMRYSTLMKKVDEGYAEINAWWPSKSDREFVVDVTFYKSNGTSKRESVMLTNVPKEIQQLTQGQPGGHHVEGNY